MPAFAVSRPQPQLWIGTSTTRRSIWSILELQVLVDALEHDPDVTVVVFDSAIVDHVLAPYDMGRASETPALPARPGCRRVWTPPSARRFCPSLSSAAPAAVSARAAPTWRSTARTCSRWLGPPPLPPCSGPGRCTTAAPQWALTERARAEIARRVGPAEHSVAQAARDFGVSRHVAMAAVRDHGRPRVDHLARLGAPSAIRLDETSFSPPPPSAGVCW